MKITMGTFDIRGDDIDIVIKVLKSGNLSSGKELVEFEEKFSNYHGFKYGVMVNSGQSALECALELAKKKKGDKSRNVLIPATTYAATLWAILRTGNNPVFGDVSLSDYNLFFESPKYTKEPIDVVMPVDLCGKECDTKWAKEIFPDAYIIRDSCEASGLISSKSDVACFSFYVSHLITSGSGGMVCLNNYEDAEYIRSFISHGRKFGGDFTKNREKWVDRFLFDKIGASYRSDNMSAALVLSQFDRLEKIVSKRRENARYLIDHEKSDKFNQHFVFPDIEYWSRCVFQFFPVVLEGIDRGEFLSYLYEKGIDTRVLLSLTNQPIFKELFGEIEDQFPNSKELNKNGFIIGCHQGMGEEEMNYIIKCFEEYIGCI